MESGDFVIARRERSERRGNLGLVVGQDCLFHNEYNEVHEKKVFRVYGEYKPRSSF